jgi:hypothetical protein
VDEWKTIQTYDLSGNDLYPVYENPSIAGDQRLGDASEDFTVYFSTSDGQETYSPDSAGEFQQFQVGSTWTLRLNAMGGVDVSNPPDATVRWSPCYFKISKVTAVICGEGDSALPAI